MRVSMSRVGLVSDVCGVRDCVSACVRPCECVLLRPSIRVVCMDIALAAVVKLARDWPPDVPGCLFDVIFNDTSAQTTGSENTVS